MLLVPTVSLGSMVSCQLYIHATNNEGCSENKLQNHIISSIFNIRNLHFVRNLFGNISWNLYEDITV